MVFPKWADWFIFIRFVIFFNNLCHLITVLSSSIKLRNIFIRRIGDQTEEMDELGNTVALRAATCTTFIGLSSKHASGRNIIQWHRAPNRQMKKSRVLQYSPFNDSKFPNLIDIQRLICYGHVIGISSNRNWTRNFPNKNKNWFIGLLLFVLLCFPVI